MKPITLLIIIMMNFSCSSTEKAAKPQIVGVPPADAGRGLVRVSKTEIRHYGGNRSKNYLVSYDNGLTWKEKNLPKTFPKQIGGLWKEACDFARNPKTGEYVRVLCIRGRVMHSKGGLDGTWTSSKDDKKNDFKPSGILRSPIFVNKGKRLLIPGHWGGTFVWYSDDGGKTFSRSNKIQAPHHKIGGVHKGVRWNHGIVEPTIVELKDGRLWMIARTAQDYHYESFSKDFGKTWSEPVPSRFAATITMPCIKRLKDGRLLMLWTNTAPLPEIIRTNKEEMKKLGKKPKGGEDVFTNRDSHHAAISEDDGKTWIGFREIILDEHRNNKDYAVTPGSNDRGKHQSQCVQLDKNRVLISLGQHPIHRKLMILDVRWLYEKERSDTMENIESWSRHKYIPVIKGHCGYNRKPGGKFNAKEKSLTLGMPKDTECTAPIYKADYQREGATWNFPAGSKGEISFKFRLNKGGQGAVISLQDRWFNPVDVTAEKFSMFKLKIKEGEKIGSISLKGNTWYELSFRWDLKNKFCAVIVNGKESGLRLKLNNSSINGISYIHFISAAKNFDKKGFSIGEIKSKVE